MNTTNDLLPRVGILCIGTELTRGEIHNSNATWLAQALTALGASVERIECVADDAAQMQRCFASMAARCRVVVATGGLGPTTDDMTSSTVADWLGVERVRDPSVVDTLKQRFERRGRQLLDSNLSQADFPSGATVLENPFGTAPGFAVEHQGCSLFFMPGVPREMKPMFDRFVMPLARTLVRGGQHQIRLHCFGLPESVVGERLQGIESEFGVRLAYRAHFPEVEVKVAKVDVSLGDAERVTRVAADEVARRLGDAVYAEGDVDLPEQIVSLLRARNLTFGAAESCTGGLLSSLLTAHPVSDFFLGSVISYADPVKTQLLGVRSELLETHGAVSAQVAEQMARGVLDTLGCDVSVALTGIAGPGGGSADKPVGLVHVAAANRSGAVSEHFTLSERPRRDVQLYAAWRALFLLRRQLLEAWSRS